MYKKKLTHNDLFSIIYSFCMLLANWILFQVMPKAENVAIVRKCAACVQ